MRQFSPKNVSLAILRKKKQIPMFQKKQNIFVDIDGTLTKETYGWDDYSKRTPILPMIQLVNDLYRRGKTIVLWTARHIEDKAVTVEWLEKYDVRYHKLILGKPHYCILLDDLAVNAKDFLENIK